MAEHGSAIMGVRTTRGAKVVGAHVAGLVAPGFEAVRTEFERNFTERGEIGAAVATYGAAAAEVVGASER